MVYVDDMYLLPIGKLNRMKMSHMAADTLTELHEMADRIGVARRWFQDKPGHPHYDVSISKRTLAVQFGAKEITMQEIVRIKTEE